ncbi:DUF6531 domain-containing protein [Burkholderia pyrrocinia]|uniref:DUF6531 domain-containing protein n=1 Tax=Burkholderia pyrrocinia TaxID=60550 RepID=UPI00064C10FA|nr:DUF6531 domain-containing protein [Burkholderia pyrrocinia]AKM01879.1 hypothetical protein ABD05_16365 [Burkholderia pyrrocinia]
MLVDLFWATAGGDVLAFMAELDTHLRKWKDSIVQGVRDASRTVRRFVLDPVSTAEQMGRVRKNTGFLSWVPSSEEIALIGIDQLLKVSGQRDAIVRVAGRVRSQHGTDAGPRVRQRGGSRQPAVHGCADHRGDHGPQGAQDAVACGAGRTGHDARAAPESRASTAIRRRKAQSRVRCRQRTACGCPKTGSNKPVNYAMGDENLEQTDFVLDGVVPIVWTRRYRSSLAGYDASPARGALEQCISPVVARAGRRADILRPG